MIPKDPERRKEMISYMLDGLSISHDSEKITEWEKDFLDSITQQFLTKGNLSDRQCEILERIYDKVM